MFDPFDAIAFDGDGRSTPQIESDDEREHAERWHRANGVTVPTIEAKRRKRPAWG